MEFADVGAHCAHPLCGQRDFLPVECSQCHKMFCAQHKSTIAHHCTALPAVAEAAISSTSEATLSPAAQCVVSACTALASTGHLSARTTCAACGATTCMAHRFPNDHDCPSLRAPTAAASKPRVADLLLAAKGGAPLSGSLAATPAAAPVAASGSGAAGTGSSSSSAAMAAKVRLMRVKSKTPVNKAIPEAERLFFEVHVHASAAPTAVGPGPTTTLHICLSRVNTVGAALDALCKLAGVRNNNADTSDETKRLHLHAGNTIEEAAERPYLPFASKLGDLEKGSEIVNGGILLLSRSAVAVVA